MANRVMSPSNLNPISPNVYWLSPDDRTDRPILGAIAGEQRTLIVDAGNSPAHANLFLSELSTVDLAPPAFLALTHWHWDHVFGTSAINLPAFAHTETKRIVAEMARLDWSDEALDRRGEEGIEIEFCRDMIKAELPDRTGLRIKPPDIAFTTRIELDLGGVTCHIVHVGGDHAADCSIVYVQEDKIMFLGDCLGADLYSSAPSHTTKNLFPMIDLLLSYDADFYLAAHDPEPISRAEMVEYTTLLKLVGRRVDQLGANREAILSDLQGIIDTPLDNDHIEMVDAFIAGLSKP